MIRETTPGAVFDCMVYLQALVNEQGPAAAVVKLVTEGRVLLFYSDEIVAELRDVLFRPKLQQKFPRLTDARAEALIQLLLEKGILSTTYRQSLFTTATRKTKSTLIWQSSQAWITS